MSKFCVWWFALKNNPRCCSKSTHSSKPLRWKYTTSCFQTTSTQHHLTLLPKSAKRWCEGTNNITSRVHQLQSWSSWVVAKNALTEKTGWEPAHEVKRSERLHTRCDMTNTNRSCYAAKWALVASSKTAQAKISTKQRKPKFRHQCRLCNFLRVPWSLFAEDQG